MTGKELRLRVLIDYRPALRQRTGVGEYVHELAAALATVSPDDVITLFSASWKDRLTGAPMAGVRAVDRRIPVTVLNFAWHRMTWPAVETLTGDQYDVVVSAHPLPIPARHAAQVVTVHDLDFLDHPERTRREIRRDYPALAPEAVRRADHVLVVSRHTAREVERRLGVASDRITICSPGAPPWSPRAEEPANGYVLFFGTLAPRKNVGVLIDAYGRLAARKDIKSRLVLAGGIEHDIEAVLRDVPAKVREKIDVIGYVQPEQRLNLYRGAAVLVMPSHTEGFGIPALEAMTVGVPVIASNRGALPEVVGDAGILIEPDDVEGVTKHLDEVLEHRVVRDRMREAGWQQAARYRWTHSAVRAREAWKQALDRRRRRG